MSHTPSLHPAHKLSLEAEGVSTYSLDKLLSLWKSDQIKVEQLAGYMLQHLIWHEKRLRQNEAATKGSTSPATAPLLPEVTHPSSK